MKLAFLSHSAMCGSLVVGSHQLAKAFARANHQVTHISAPLSIAHAVLLGHQSYARERLKRWMSGGDSVHGALDVVPFGWLPWNVARISPALMNLYSRHMLVAPLRGLGGLGLDTAECLFVDEPRFVGMAVSRPGRTLIYRATDLYAQMRRDPTIVDAERMICRRADALVATSVPVAEHLQRISGREVHVISNGVEFEHFASSGEVPTPQNDRLPGRREDRAVYAGTFDRRFGIGALRAAARGLPNRRFLLVGPGGKAVAARLGLPNVFALGAAPYSMLPGILRQCVVGLLPMSSDTSNAGRSPMKLYEYAAAGLAVAATSTGELRRRPLVTLCLAESDAQFPLAVAEAFDRAGDESLIAAARVTAQQEGWAIKANQLLALAR